MLIRSMFTTCCAGIAMLAAGAASATVLSGSVSDPLDPGTQYRLESDFIGPNPQGRSTIRNRVIGTPVDDDVYVEWKTALFFTATLKCCEIQAWTNSLHTFRVPQVAGPGDAKTFALTVTGAEGSGSGQYYEPGIADQRLNNLIDDLLSLPGATIQLIADLSGSPTRLRLTSEVERVSDTEYEYRNFVENFTEFAIPFEWQQAGLAGNLDPFDPVNNVAGIVSSSMISTSAPTELSGSASALLTLGFREECDFNAAGDLVCVSVPDSGNEFSILANVLAPRSAAAVPAPATLLLFGSALLGLGALGRRRVRAWR